ncbi:MAG: lipocalin family protein [Bacteroidetes bacterium]|jgi:hypothetical protein|nr:lipocalin family protein [Bacteroidota bacterium]
MKNNFLIASLMAILVLSSCADSKNNKLIIGEWNGATWLVDGNASGHDAAHTSFSFNDNGKYVFVYGETRQEGTYKVENDMLFTTPANENEMMVKIKKLTKDSLVFDMNRGGQAEELTLLRK